jgi:hypothetical protein
MLDLWKIEPPYLQLSTQIGNTCDVQRHNKFFQGKKQTHEGGSIGKYGYCHNYKKQSTRECSLQAQKNLSNLSQLSNGKKRKICINLLK